MVFQKFDVIVYRKLDSRDIKSSVINVALFVSVAATAEVSRFASRLFATASALNITDILPFLDNNKSSSTSQLIKGKSRVLKKLLKCFNGITTSLFNELLFTGVHPIIFVMYSKDLLGIIFFIIYHIIIFIIFICIIVYLISIIIPRPS